MSSPGCKTRIGHLKHFLDNFGGVNLGAREDYERLFARHQGLETQITDLVEGKESLQKIMRELDDAILHLRFNEEAIGTWMFRSEGDSEQVLAADRILAARAEHWLVREILLFARRVLKRIDVSARSLFTIIEPGSCFAGTLFELVLAADQSYMLAGQFEDDEAPPATVSLSELNFGCYAMVNGITRLETRFQHELDAISDLRTSIAEPLEAERAMELGLVTFIPDDIDWEGA